MMAMSGQGSIDTGDPQATSTDSQEGIRFTETQDANRGSVEGLNEP